MRIGFTAFVTLLVAMPMAAHAGPARLTDAQFLRASRCAALSGLPQMKAQGANVDWLPQVVKAESASRDRIILDRAKEEAKDVARAGKRSRSPAQDAALKAKRDEACAGLDRLMARL
jgi:hypothetical protein